MTVDWKPVEKDPPRSGRYLVKVRFCLRRGWMTTVDISRFYLPKSAWDKRRVVAWDYLPEDETDG